MTSADIPGVIGSTDTPIVTFYSYKGGVGRSMLLANAAVMLAQNRPLDVIVVDWDLEAPGLHRFFGIDPRKINDGVIDYLYRYWELAEDPSRAFTAEDLALEPSLIEVRNYPSGGRVRLLAAGAQDDEYARRVNNFDWDVFYSRWNGAQLIEYMRQELKQRGDRPRVVLVDSRTGITDTGGICTIQLPDIVVLVFAYNEQNIAGVEAVARDLSAEKPIFDQLGRRPVILALPSRKEISEIERLRDWERRAAVRLKPYLQSELITSRYSETLAYFRDIAIQYVPYFAYGEEIAAEVEMGLELVKPLPKLVGMLLGESAQVSVQVDAAALTKQREFLDAHYDMEELRDLSFTLGVDYDSLRGEGKRGKARELVLLLSRLGRLGELLKALRETRRESFDAAGLSTEAAFVEGPAPVGVVEAPAPETVAVRRSFEPEMVLIPEGEFWMGSDGRKDKRAHDDETPQHRLYLPGYYLAKTPVTNGQYAAFVEATGHQRPEHWKEGRIPQGKEEHPVVYVSWHDAVAYCGWLAEVTGKGYRLPSEAEWEKGARGSEGRIYPWGDEWDARRCNSGEGGVGGTTPVGAYPQGESPYGLLDMTGNVWEWTISLWGKDAGKPAFRYPYDAGDGREDLDVGPDVRRVLRGGAWVDNQWDLRCTFRLRLIQNHGYYGVGFRVVVAPGV